MVYKRKGILFVISGPSGAGKGTVLKQVFARVEGLAYSVSATTRQPRVGEFDTVHYFFRTVPQFEDMIARGEFIEYVHKFGNYYGTVKSNVEALLDNGLDVFLEIETIGAENIRNTIKDAILIFITPSNVAELESRLRVRASEEDAQRDQRVQIGKTELKSVGIYDYVVINDCVEDCVTNIQHIILAERCRTKNNSQLVDYLVSHED